MRHFIRLNTAGVGYALYRGDPAGGFDTIPLDAGLAGAPSMYRATQNRLDDGCNLGLDWTVCARSETGNNAACVGYAAAVNAVDDKGRGLLTLLHVVELDSHLHIPRAICSILRVQSHERGTLVSRAAAYAACEPGAFARALTETSTTFERYYEETGPLLPGAGAGPSPRRIWIDRAGTAPFAWLAAAAAHAGSSGWEMYDTRDDEGRLHVCVSDLSVPGGSADAEAVPVWELMAKAASMLAHGSPRSGPAEASERRGLLGRWWHRSSETRRLRLRTAAAERSMAECREANDAYARVLDELRARINDVRPVTTDQTR